MSINGASIIITLVFLSFVCSLVTRPPDRENTVAKAADMKQRQAVPLQRRSPWIGVVLSLFVAGAGQIVSGNVGRGIKWFVVIHALDLLTLLVLVWSWAPIALAIALVVIHLAVWLWMLKDSFRPPLLPESVTSMTLILLAVPISAALLSGKAYVATSFVQGFRLPTSSMAQTATPGDHILVQKNAYSSSEPARGDVVAFDMKALSPIPTESEFYIARIIGLPGDRVELIGRVLYVNGKVITEKYAQFVDPYSVYEHYGPYTVPRMQYFVMGDNRDISNDSRFYGPIPGDAILGKATKINWPLHRIGAVH